MDIGEKINTNQSVLGKDLLAWIHAGKGTKTPEEQTVSSKLYHRYVADYEGNPKNKIYEDAYYYVNYNDRFNPNVFFAYLVRDKSRSPRKIPDSLIKLNIVGANTSYKGALIQEWAYYQNGSSENEYYMEGNEIITKYFESEHPVRLNVYYYVVKTAKGIKVLRDEEKSPRKSYM